MPGGSDPEDTGSGGGSDNSDSGGDSIWKKLGKVAPAAGGLLGALFGTHNEDKISPQINKVNAGASQLQGQGSSLFSAGTDALGPAMNYFKALASGDPSQALAATQPQRGRVIDQYDAARRSAGQFGARGGGQASSELESRSKEAGQLADITSQARSEGASKLAELGSDVTKTGLSAEESANKALADTLGPLLEQQKQANQSSGGFWKGLGELAGAALGAL
jgi:hypothetical protein